MHTTYAESENSGDDSTSGENPPPFPKLFPTTDLGNPHTTVSGAIHERVRGREESRHELLGCFFLYRVFIILQR
jgi:hypothetical protein